MSQNIGILTFDRPRDVATTAVPLKQEWRRSVSGLIQRLDWYSSLDTTVVAEVQSIVITAGSANDLYAISVTVGTNTKTYCHLQKAGDTATTIAAFLAEILDSHPDVTASAATGTITVTAAIPGTDIALANTNSTATENVVISTTTAPVGTPLHRLIARLDINPGFSSTGFPEFTIGGTWYKGDAIATSQIAIPNAKITGPLSMDTILTANGITRTA